jgi:periplasmic protein TonB
MSLLFPRLAAAGGVAVQPKAGLATVTIVAGAHVAVLLLLLAVMPAERLAEMARPLTVRLIELAPKPAVEAPPAPPQPRPRRPEPPARVLAVTTPIPERAAAPVFMIAPAPEPAPVAVPPAPTFAVPAPAPITAARFDAAYLNNPKPVYPNASRRLGEEGKVVLRVHVDPDGRPSEIEIRTSSGFPRLDAAAYEAVSRWRFVPARRGDEPIAAWVAVPIAFNLEG